MTLNQIESTFICQLSKPENRKLLEEVAARKDSSNAAFVRYYKDFVSMLINTPAWGVSGVNKVVNELRDAVIAKLTNAKKGKTTAWAHAKKMLNKIDHFGNEEAKPYHKEKCALKPILTDEDLLELLLNND